MDKGRRKCTDQNSNLGMDPQIFHAEAFRKFSLSSFSIYLSLLIDLLSVGEFLHQEIIHTSFLSFLRIWNSTENTGGSLVDYLIFSTFESFSQDFESLVSFYYQEKKIDYRLLIVWRWGL